MKHFTHRRLVCLLLAAVVLLPTNFVCAEDEDDNSPAAREQDSAQNIERVIAQIDAQIMLLRSDDHKLREHASQNLLGFGSSAIGPLFDAASGSDAEVTVRAITVLEEMFTSSDESVSTLAGNALLQMATADNPELAARAKSVLVRHADWRQVKALAAFEELGGKVVFQDELEDSAHVRRNFMFSPTMSIVQDDDLAPYRMREIHSLRIDSEWKGGVEGLKHIQSLQQALGRTPKVYVISGAPVSVEKIEALAAKIPGLSVERRGRATLGVTGAPGAPCRILSVSPGGAAEKAGLQQNDIIVAVAGEPIEKFQDLVDVLKTRNADERVPVSVQRGIRTLEISVTLGGWDGPTAPK